ncbi:electron transport complex subunit RsxC [Vibrio sp. TH_r3]|uniref:electron transport complex subunit RsxC n=1 Tax=Vibrio sp. TH_r3 TaxID=3082084 RepID=UPI0029530E6E|nr:electron transport complex subunit RsxC [Vibrio sp. TH_r3]MDV7103119.1 electron transport complex subunit RsxC [Vibrio sp. TH_r3]
MVSLVEQIRHGALWSFPGGIHPPENKIQSTQTDIVNASLPEELVLPVKQHIGRPGDLLVKVGDKVLKGQPLTKFTASFMLPVHAPTSGKIIAIEPRQTAHPSGLTETCIVLKPDNEDAWISLNPHPDFQNLSPEKLINTIRQAGISGLGGAGFPTGRKIQSGIAKTEILIINAAECEPYITADDMLMREHADEIVQGIDVLKHMLNPELIIIAVEDNKPEAIKALEVAALNVDLLIRAIPTKYPSGGEKQLIKILTNKEVPQKGIPADIGILVQNIGTVHAIKKAVIDGKPLIERIVTLTGNAFKQPQNVNARLGTPVQALLNEFHCQPDKKLPRIIMGGPMMGFTLPSTDVPITKTTNCLLAPTKKEIAHKQNEIACIRCGQCAEVCPASLLPQQLFWYAKDKNFDKCEELHLADCIECGACAYVCPSEIPLVHYYRQAKAEIRINTEEAEAAERAKLRFEERKARLERDKAERENRFKQAAENRRKEMAKPDNNSNDAVAAAITRVKAQKTSSTDAPAVKPAVAAAIAKAKARQAAASQTSQATPDNSEMMKLREERKRLARERKAKKANQSSADSEKESLDNTAQSTDSAQDKKKAAVAAAIARAKAKKSAQAKQADTDTDADSPTESSTESSNAVSDQQQSTDSVQDKKKAAVAAAIARAKAKKLAQAKQADTDTDADSPTESSTESSNAVSDQQQSTDSVQDKKKAAVAAAIARAKAKKLAQAKQADADTDANSSTESSTESSNAVSDQQQSTDSAQDKKKAAVAAAIARAKAKKAAAANSTNIKEKE